MGVDSKTVRIFQVRASGQTKGLERGWKRRARLGRDALTLAPFARVKLLHHALPISLPTVLQSTVVQNVFQLYHQSSPIGRLIVPDNLTRSHGGHIGIPKQWNGGHVSVPNQSCGSWTPLISYACKFFLLCRYAGHVSENALSFDARGKQLIYLNNAHCEAANRSPFPKFWETRCYTPTSLFSE